ncbi:FKBP-type peptidyl-prolyl cis-trans isomerase [Serratia marcescens]|nr:FKBP-type peptidyl-prolyl cis-trans isomerase [Serratia marcescens]
MKMIGRGTLQWRAGQRPVTACLTVITSLLLMPPAQADNGAPALLQFAEQYQGQTSMPEPPRTPGQPSSENPAKVGTPANKTASTAGSTPTGTGNTTLRQTLRQRELQLNQQRVTLREQAAELATLRAALEEAQIHNANTAPSSPLPTDFTPLHHLIDGLRKAVTGTPDDKRSAALIAESHQQTNQAREALGNSQTERDTLIRQVTGLQKRLHTAEQAATTDAQHMQAMQETLTDLKSQLDEHKQALTAARQQSKEEDAQQSTQAKALADAQKQVATLTRDKQTLEGDISALRARAKSVVKPATLVHPAGRQAYAAGTALGKDIIELLKEHQGVGVTVDRQTVLAGVIDAFSGQYQLTSDVLAKALDESEATLHKAQVAAAAGKQKTGENFITAFSKQTGAKRSPSGFWYKVEYVGDEVIADDAIVDVVVKESLTDGTVIQDMDVAGNVLSQPLSAYPPLFREAIGHLKNHGSMTLVVPPALAYGDEGYPPKVPANATMVYVLRVENSKAPDSTSSTSPTAAGKITATGQRQP